MSKRETWRKLLAGLLVGLGLLFTLASLAAIVLVWVYRTPVKTEAVARLESVDAELAQAQTALQNAKTELQRTLRIVSSAEAALAALKDELTQAKSLFGEVGGALDTQLLPGLKSSRANIEQAKTSLQNLRDSLAQLNQIPFVHLNIPGDALLANLIGVADSLDRQIGQAQTLVEKAATFSADASYLMGGDLTETKQNLKSFLDTVNAYEQKVTNWRAQVRGLINSLPGWVDTAAIVLTLFLLWFGFSQAGVFLHGMALWRGQNPLDVFKKAL